MAITGAQILGMLNIEPGYLADCPVNADPTTRTRENAKAFVALLLQERNPHQNVLTVTLKSRDILHIIHEVRTDLVTPEELSAPIIGKMIQLGLDEVAQKLENLLPQAEATA